MSEINASKAFEENKESKGSQEDNREILSAMTLVLYDDLSFDVLPESEINGEVFQLNPNSLPDFISHLKKIEDKVNTADALKDMVQVQSGSKS